jgi:hypothetical protein
VEDATVTLLEWLAAVALVVGSAAVLWAVKIFDDLAEERPRPTAVAHRKHGPMERKAA